MRSDADIKGQDPQSNDMSNAQVSLLSDQSYNNVLSNELPFPGISEELWCLRADCQRGQHEYYECDVWHYRN